MLTSETLSRLYEIIGGHPVFIAGVPREKRPKVKGYEQLTWPETQTEAYQADLRQSNIGVLMGVDRIGVIDIDDDEQVEPFLRLNPGLRQTVISRGSRGVKIFVRWVENESLREAGFPSEPCLKHNYPIKRKLTKAEMADGAKHGKPWGELRMSRCQSTIWGEHPSGGGWNFVRVEEGGAIVDCGLEPEWPVKEVEFAAIAWPDGLKLGWELEMWEHLTARYGRPWSYQKPLGEDGGPGLVIGGLSAHFWAGWFAVRHDVLWEPLEVRFYEYDRTSGAWEVKDENEIRAMISDDLLEVSRSAEMKSMCYGDGEWSPSGWQRLQAGALAKLEAARTVENTTNIMKFLRGLVAKPGIFKTGTGIVHCANGMLDLREGATVNRLTLRPFSPRYFSRNPLPVAFDPKASAPRFTKDLVQRSLSGRKDDVDLFSRWAGAALLGRNDWQKILIFTGTAAGGKSTMMRVVQTFLGRRNVAQLRTEHLSERFELFNYVGKTLLCGADVPGNFLQQKGAYMIKALTGGDWLDAEVKAGKDFLPLEGNFNCGVVCNSRLKVRLWGDAEAWRRRLMILICDAPPIEEEKKVKDFDAWLVANEGPGILNIFIRGAFKILRSGKMEMSERQKKSVNDLLDESDSIRVFLSERVEAHKGACVTKDDLRSAYAEFCDENGWDAETERTFETQCKQVMLEKFRAKPSGSIPDAEGKNKSGYRGVQFKRAGEAEQAAEDGETPF